MDIKLLRRLGYLLFSIGLLTGISFSSKAQSFSYSEGALSVDITVINPCPGFGGAIQFTINSSEASSNALLAVFGPINLFPTQSIPEGGTFTFNPSQTLPIGIYDWIISDGTNTVGSLATPTAPKITLTSISSPAIVKDIETNNSSCVTPNGQIQASITGGSLTIGAGSYDYNWTSNNTEIPVTGFSGTTDGASPLNLATLLGKTGLKGGIYTLQVSDNFSQCPVTEVFTITDPSPAIFTVSPSSPPAYNICAGNNITLTLSGSEAGVTYEVLRNGSSLPTPITFLGTGASPFVMTFPSAQFSGGNNILVQATNGFCTVVPMSGSVSLAINPLPTASISGTTTICSGASATLTFTLPSSGTYNVVYTDGTTNFTANGISNGATVNVFPSATTTYTIVSVTNTATLCTVTAPHANITGSAVITVNPLPTASISGTGTVCTGGTAVLTFTLPVGSYNVVYTDGTTNFNANGISNGATVNVIPPLGNTTYTIVSVSNTASTCSVTAPHANITGSAVVTVNPLPTASISGTTTICSGTNATLTFTLSAGTYNVVYTDGTTNFNANGITSGATVSVSPSTNRTYTIVSITNTAIASCTVTAPSANITGSAVITVNPSPTANISGTSTICAGGSATLTFTLPSSGTYNVVYTDGTTNFNANGISNGATVSVSPPGNRTYTIVSVSNTATSCSVTAPSANITGSAVITVNPLPTASISGTATICAGASTALTFTLPAGTYNVVYTDGTTNFNANGITSGATVSVGPPTTRTYTIVSVSNTATTCSVTAPHANITGSAVVTISSTPVLASTQTKTICDGENVAYEILLNPANLPVGTVFNWPDPDGAGPATLGVNVPMGVAGTTHINDVLTNTTTAAIMVTYSITPSIPGCAGTAVPVDITVQPTPAVTSLLVESACAGSSTTRVHYGPMTGLPDQYSVDFDDAAFTDVVNAPLIPTLLVPILATAAPGIYSATLTVRNSLTGCSSVGTPITININGVPVPTITSGPANVCVNSTANTYTTQPGKTGYVWTVSAGGTITAGLGTNEITVTWNSTGSQTVTVNYTENTCAAATPASLTVNVTPMPVMAANQIKTICSGDNAAYEILLTPANLPVGTVFNWPDPDGSGPATAGVNVPMGVAGTTHINDVLTNTTTAPIVITYAVTPSTGGCAGTPQNIAITVNPTPVLATGQAKSICTGANVAYEILLNPANLPAGTMFNWPDPDGAGPATAGVNVLAGAPGTIHINDVLTNTTTATVVVTYSITPSLGTCVGATEDVVITVNPLPVLVTPQVTGICSGENVDYEILLNPATLPAGTVFNWPDPDGAGPATAGLNVPMGAAGTLHITDALMNTTGSPITLTYVITPTNGACNGTPRNVLVTVDPAPALVPAQAKSICTGDNVAYEILLNPANLPVGTTFNWPDPDGAGPATAGVNVPMGAPGTTHINDVLTATGAAVVITYVITPTSGTGCDGPPQDIVITINPNPVIAANQTKTICSGANAGFEILMNPVNQPTGTVFNWSDPDGAGPATAGVNVPMGTAGTIHINDALTNSTAAPITVTYVVTPSVGTCLGTPVNIDIVVDPFPAPVLVTPQSKAICSGDNTAYEILLNPANQPAGTLFNWPDPDGAGPATSGTNVLMGAAGTTHINDILVNTTNAPIAVTYVVT
ncbi:MAG TPA: PKD-like domain-containing protein, partial [Chryseolinea sp.]